MNKYAYSSTDFGINELGIFCLRSGYVYKSISHEMVSSINIRKGYLVQNRFLLLALSLVVLVLGYYVFFVFLKFNMDDYYETFNNVSNLKGWKLFVYLIGFCFSTLFFSVFLIYKVFSRGTIMLISTEHETFKFDLSEIEKRGELSYFKKFLQQKKGTRHLDLVERSPCL